MSVHLEKLVLEWYRAQVAIDEQVQQAKSGGLIPSDERDAKLRRLVDAHNALRKYAKEDMGG